MDSDRLRQRSFHGQAEGDRAPFKWGALGPQELAPDPCKAAPLALGQSSCLNPVPQERHLLVIGTMEMASWVLDLALGSELLRRQKGAGRVAPGKSGLLCHVCPSPVQPCPPCQDWPSQKCSQPTGRGKVSG